MARQPAPAWAAEAGHDLRQSLQAATLQAHALVLQARQQALPAWAQLGAQMAESLQHCHRLLDSLLAGYPAGSPAPPADWQRVDLGPLLDALCQAWQPMADHHGLRLTLRSPTPSPQVHSDALLLRRVLDNLVGNALAHTAHGGVALHLRPAADPHLAGPVLSVADTGPGLGFDVTLDASRRPASAAGHGLGLLIVRRLCAQLGIGFDLQPGQAGAGTLATLTWPAQAEAGGGPP